MGKINAHHPVKLVIGLIAKNPALFKSASLILKKKFGLIDFESPLLEFNHTDYYKEEFGCGLKRVFISFKKLLPPEKLAEIKLYTNKVEEKFLVDKKRTVNIDPGYLDLAKLVLASTKNFYHRIYIGKKIFAEITLSYQNKDFRTWEWTYPDYRSPEYIEIFKKIRGLYLSQLK